MSDAFAELFEHNDAGTPLALGAALAFSKWASSGLGEAGPSDLIVPDAVNDDMTVGVNGAGLYEVSGTISFGSDKPNSTTEGSAFVNGVEASKASFHRTIGNANDQGSTSLEGLLRLVAGDVIDLRFNSTVMNTTLKIHHVTFIVRSVLRDI